MKQLKKQERLLMYEGEHITAEKHMVVSSHPLHWHSYFEMEIILSGAGKYVINDIEYDIAERCIFFLTPIDFHYVEADKDTEIFNISFDEEMLDEKNIIPLIFSKTKKAYLFSNKEYERIVKACELLEYECACNGECKKHLLQYVLSCVLKKESGEVDNNHGEHYAGIKKAIVYMQLHFREKITLSSLAAESGYHPTYFSELYKRFTGENYTIFLSKLRVGYARTLLANGFSVSDTCFSSGFRSLSSFGSAFKKYSGVSPREYAKNAHL